MKLSREVLSRAFRIYSTQGYLISSCSYAKHRKNFNTLLSRVYDSIWAPVKCSSTQTGDPAKVPLHGIRVLDLTRILAGPYCTMIMGDLGAEVIKVEKPGTGDDTRTWGPPFISSESAYFLSINRNKKSIAINLKEPKGANLVKQLAAHCDVLIENYIPGQLEKMGLSYQQIKKDNPRLIYCSITGYGQTGPYRQRAGYDVIASGVGGLMHITGPQDGGPCRVGVAMTDLSTGLYAWGAILSAFIQRQRTGKGQHIDCNLINTQVATLTHIASNYLNAGWEGARFGTGHPSIVPYQAFQTKDGHMIVGAGNNHLFKEVCQVMELGDLANDPKFIDNPARVKNRVDLIDTMSKRFQTKTNNEWLAVFEGSKFPYGPINNMHDVFSDPQVLHNNMIQSMDHPKAGNIRIPGPAVSYSESDLVLRHPPPLLGEHTEEILTDLLQLQPGQIQELKQQQVIE